jgi:hypothetical protein
MTIAGRTVVMRRRRGRPKKMEMTMSYRAFVTGIALMGVLVGSPALAAGPQFRSHDGQYPLPRALSGRTAQPECGFAATESYGPNGFQLCDPKNIYN